MTAAAPQRQTIGGKYTLVQRLGEGGMGEVWLAHNIATKGEVALKRLTKKTIDGEARFRHEAAVAVKLEHRRIARVYDLIEDHGDLWLVMERLRGETMRQRLQRGKLTVEETVRIACEVLEALEHAEKAGVVHRDINPSNIFLTEDGAVLIDFGVAKTASTEAPKSVTGQALGTPEYMSPEQIRLAKLDGRSDQFSLAVTIIEALTGICPFLRKGASASIAAVLEEEIDPDPSIPPRLWLVVDRALGKQPYERFTDCKEMREALRSTLGPSTEPQVSTISPISRRRRQRKIRPAYIIGLVALTTTIAAVALARVFMVNPPQSYTSSPSVDPPVKPHLPAQLVTASPEPPPSASSTPTATTSKTVTVVRPTSSGTVAAPQPSKSSRPIATTPGF